MGENDKTIRRPNLGKVKKYFLRFLDDSDEFKAQNEWEINSPNILLGRASTCNISFRSNDTVSRKHATMIQEGHNWFIENLSETNSTLINGNPLVERWCLSEGDIIQLSYQGPRIEFFTREENVGFIDQTRPENHPKGQDLNGLSGWLVFVGIGIVLTPIKMIYSIVPTYSEMFGEGIWDALTDPLSSNYIEYFAELVIAELLVNIGLLLFSIFLVGQYFGKKSTFPRYYIGFRLSMIVLLFLDWLATSAMFPEYSDMDAELYNAVIGALIWIPYMISSERVKQTFIK